MEQEYCPNCNTPLTGKFCSACGQAASTHRITPKHFVLHEFLHGVWHMDNKIVFTLKELFTRPGHAARDYLEGKRVKYYNVFYLLLLVLGVLYFANEYVLGHFPPEMMGKQDKEVVVQFTNFMIGYNKFIIFGQLPFYALNGWLFFRRLKYNYAEHVIIAGFALLGFEIIVLISTLFQVLLLALGVPFFIVMIISGIFGLLSLLFPIWLYAQLCLPKYNLFSFSWRFILFGFLSFIEIVIVFSAVYIFFFSDLI